jgi:lactoylglutathione lyase
MKRFHVHVRVKNLDESIRFYSTLFNAPPTVLKHDYAKWMMEDPRVNFAISTHGDAAGIDHLGFQVEEDRELAAVATRLKEADRKILEQDKIACCYARSDKAWVADPQGVLWETFKTVGDVAVYGESLKPEEIPIATSAMGKACCARPQV